MFKVVIRCKSIILAVSILVLIPSVVIAKDTISIDGYYDEWEDKPVTAFSYGDHNNKDARDVAFLSDGSDLYVHIKMPDISGKYNGYNIFNLCINDQYNTDVIIMYKNSDNTINWSNSFDKLKVGNNELGVFSNQSDKPLLGVATITIYDKDHKKGDEVEFSISLEKLRMFCNNIKVDNMKTITLTCSGLGNQKIILVGTSTAPYVGLCIILLAIIIVPLYRKINTYRKNSVLPKAPPHSDTT